MYLSEFDFNLPKNKIAKKPKKPRDEAKLLVVSRQNDELIDSKFANLDNFLKKGDFLVFNDSRVIPARLFGKIKNKNIEVLLLKKNKEFWEVMLRPAKIAEVGSKIKFSKGLEAEIVEAKKDSIKIEFNEGGEGFWQIIGEMGEVPLPPYILKARDEKHSKDIDKVDYQTIYAKRGNSVAAPTAGLHFTKELMNKIKTKGVEVGFLRLDVGLGTFQPIRVENIQDHKMHTEYFDLKHSLVKKLNKAKEEGRRVIAVGTTTVRVLESCQKDGVLYPHKGETDIYIYPGYKFEYVDGLITNFHLPKSSLLLLVSAFYSKEGVLNAYNHAIRNDYRFYSYGDGMLII